MTGGDGAADGVARIEVSTRTGSTFDLTDDESSVAAALSDGPTSSGDEISDADGS